MIIIRTAPRRGGVDYLPELVDAVEREGLKGYVITDGTPPRKFPGWGWRVTGRDRPSGSREAGWRALECMVDLQVDGLLLEDDVMPVPGAVRRMFETEVPPDWMWVSFWDNRTKLPRDPGTFGRPAVEFSGSLAMKVPLRTARAVMEANPWGYDHPTLLPLHDWDRALGLFCAEKKIGGFYGLRRPSLVEHRGDVTSTNSQRKRAIKAAWLEGSKP